MSQFKCEITHVKDNNTKDRPPTFGSQQYNTSRTLFDLTFYARDKATAEEEEYQEDEIFDGK